MIHGLSTALLLASCGHLLSLLLCGRFLVGLPLSLCPCLMTRAMLSPSHTRVVWLTGVFFRFPVLCFSFFLFFFVGGVGKLQMFCKRCVWEGSCLLLHPSVKLSEFVFLLFVGLFCPWPPMALAVAMAMAVCRPFLSPSVAVVVAFLLCLPICPWPALAVAMAEAVAVAMAICRPFLSLPSLAMTVLVAGGFMAFVIVATFDSLPSSGGCVSFKLIPQPSNSQVVLPSWGANAS